MICIFQISNDARLSQDMDLITFPIVFSCHIDKNIPLNKLGEAMIYSDDFVWLHFPKCAGTKIEKIFRTYYSSARGVLQDQVDPKIDPQATWHDTIAAREKRNPDFRLGEKVIICSFRRLPTWLESRYSFEVQRSPQLNHRPELLLEGKFLEQGDFQNHADYYVKQYVPEFILRSDKLRFIRMEYFELDFKCVFEEFLDITVIPDWEFSKKVNISKSRVPDKIRNQLFQHQHEVYEKCPYWKAVEDVAYG
jgi:hypothetical protein